MVTEREIYIFEEDGKFYFTDQYDLNRVVFSTEESRQKWIDKFESATGKKPKIITGKPDVRTNLKRGL